MDYMQILGQIIGPAIGGAIAVIGGYWFTKWEKNNEQNRKKKMFASVFLLELKKLNAFIDGIHNITTKDSFLLFEGERFDINGELVSPYDTAKEPILIEYFKENPFYRITTSSSLITQKNPFEMFYSEIYSFQNDNLINDLIRVDKLLNETNLRLAEYMKRHNGTHGSAILLDFLVNIPELQKNILKILSNKDLERIA
jgi:hypothetical protein